LKLSPKQRAFVTEYLKDFNGTQAAIRAGYSPKSAYSQAERLLRKAEIQKLLREAQEKAAKKATLTRERALEILNEIAENKATATGNRINALAQAGKFEGWEADKRMRLEVEGTILLPPGDPLHSGKGLKKVHADTN